MMIDLLHSIKSNLIGKTYKYMWVSLQTRDYKIYIFEQGKLIKKTITDESNIYCNDVIKILNEYAINGWEWIEDITVFNRTPCSRVDLFFKNQYN